MRRAIAAILVAGMVVSPVGGPVMAVAQQAQNDGTFVMRTSVERVLTNMWIYRQRLGQDAPDLDALASNAWPTYVSMDESTPKASQHAASR